MVDLKSVQTNISSDNSIKLTGEIVLTGTEILDIAAAPNSGRTVRLKSNLNTYLKRSHDNCNGINNQETKVALEDIKNDETRWIVEKIGDKYLFKTIKSVPNCVAGGNPRTMSIYIEQLGRLMKIENG